MARSLNINVGQVWVARRTGDPDYYLFEIIGELYDRSKKEGYWVAHKQVEVCSMQCLVFNQFGILVDETGALSDDSVYLDRRSRRKPIFRNPHVR